MFIQPFRAVVLAGTVTAIGSGSFSLLVGEQNHTVDVNGQTTYVESGVAAAGFSNLAIGDHVEVFATKTATAGTVDAEGVVIFSA